MFFGDMCFFVSVYLLSTSCVWVHMLFLYIGFFLLFVAHFFFSLLKMMFNEDLIFHIYITWQLPFHFPILRDRNVCMCVCLYES
jgi:hypothetical protein